MNILRLVINSDIQKNVVLLGLPERVGQVVVNLLDNAVSFSRPKGSITVQLHKKWRRKPLLVVEDSGPGVKVRQVQREYLTGFTPREVDMQKFKILQVWVCLYVAKL